MLQDLLLYIVILIARIHGWILSLNDAYEYNFSDKELHFIVIGVLGMLILLATYPVFKWLAKKQYILLISWIYAFTLVIVIAFAIEIGQRVTHTGAMEFSDIAFGAVGFLAMFIVYAFIRMVVKVSIAYISGKFGTKNKGEE